jgi:thiol-disulfide isomerase/thioredoxin
MLKILVIMLSLVVLLAGCGGKNPLLGKPAPDFQFQGSSEGQPISLSDLKGSPVLLNFWASWCGPCVHEMPYLQQIYDKWQAMGLVLLAVNIMESPAEVDNFMRGKGLNFPVLLDSEGAIAKQYNIEYIPATFFIDSGGIVQEVREGAFQSVAEIEESLFKLIGVPAD